MRNPTEILQRKDGYQARELQFGDIPNDDLRRVLERVSNEITDTEFAGSDLDLLDGALGMKPWDVRNLYHTVLNNGVIAFFENEGGKKKYFLDENGVYAFATVAWAHEQTHRHFGETSGKYWASIVSTARKGLGPSYLAGFIHDIGSKRVMTPAVPESNTQSYPTAEAIPGEIEAFPMAKTILDDIQAARVARGEEVEVTPVLEESLGVSDKSLPTRNESRVFVRFYEAIGDEKIRYALERIDEIIGTIDTWPLPVSSTLADRFPMVVRRRDISFRKRVESARRVITFSEDGRTLGRDELRTFLLFYYSYDLQHTLALDERVDRLRRNLGRHPLAALIHDPIPTEVHEKEAPVGDSIYSGLRNAVGQGVAPRSNREQLNQDKILQVLEGMTWQDIMRVRDAVVEVVKDANVIDKFYIPFDPNTVANNFSVIIQLIMRAKSVWEGTEFDSTLSNLHYRGLLAAFLQFESNFADSPGIARLNGKQLWQIVDIMEKRAREKSRV